MEEKISKKKSILELAAECPEIDNKKLEKELYYKYKMNILQVSSSTSEDLSKRREYIDNKRSRKLYFWIGASMTLLNIITSIATKEDNLQIFFVSQLGPSIPLGMSLYSHYKVKKLKKRYND